MCKKKPRTFKKALVIKLRVFNHPTEPRRFYAPDTGAIPPSKVQPPSVNITVAGESPGSVRLALRLIGQPGKRYVVESSTELIRWSTLDYSLIENTVVDLADTTQSGATQRFYRLSPQ